MRVLLAKNSGFCFGVRRAVETAEKLAAPAETVYTYGHIIHNTSVVEELRARNVVPVESPDELPAGCTLIIRAHGAPPSVYAACEEKGNHVVDATCPFVKRIHNIVREAEKQGSRVLIAGKPDHPEVVGIRGCAGQDAIVLEDAAAAKRLTHIGKATLVAQTTLPQAAYDEICQALLALGAELEICDTICDTTRARQAEAVEIAKRSTHVFVLGSKDSANTMQLQKLCETWCKSARIVDAVDKLSLDNLQSDDIIGVVAGASAPDRMIREVLQVMSELEKTTIETIQAEASAEEIAVTKPVETTEDTIKETVLPVAGEIAETAEDLVEIVEEEIDVAVETAAEMIDDAKAVPNAAAEAAMDMAEDAVNAAMDEAKDIAEAVEAAVEPEAAAAEPETEKAEDPVEAPVEAAPEKAELSPEKAKEAAEQSEFAQAFEKTMTRIRNGQVIEGTVISIVDGEVFVNISYKSDGVIPRNEFSSDPDAKPSETFKEGDKIEVEVTKVNDGEGNVLLSRKNVESKKIWDDLMDLEDITSRVFEATGKEVVKGGIIADLGGIRAFVPASQVSVKYIENLGEFVGQPMRLKVLEVDKQRKRIVASQKQVLLAEAAAEKHKKWEALVVGSKMNGTVRRITDFGAFVDIGGIDGLVHVTDAAWGRVKHPSDVFSINQEIEVLVLNVDVEKERVSLGYKQLQPKPWALAEQKYPLGTIVEGKVVRIVPFGAFVALESTIDGLIHISQVALQRIAKVEDELKVGDIVRCKVLEVNQEAKRISLSRKEALLEEDPELAAQFEAERVERERQFAERQEQRQQQRDQQQQQRASRDSSRPSDRGDSGERQGRGDRRRRNEDGDYELPPVQEATTSLAALFQGFKVEDADEAE